MAGEDVADVGVLLYIRGVVAPPLLAIAMGCGEGEDMIVALLAPPAAGEIRAADRLPPAPTPRG